MISPIIKYVTMMEEIAVDSISILKIAKSVNVLILKKVSNLILMQLTSYDMKYFNLMFDP